MKILLLLQVLVPVLDCHPASPDNPLLESVQGVYAFLVQKSPKLVPVSSCGLTSTRAPNRWVPPYQYQTLHHSLPSFTFSQDTNACTQLEALWVDRVAAVV